MPLPSANELKTVRSLSQKKFRDSLGMFVVEGEKMVAEAEGAGYEIVKVFRTEEIGHDQMARLTLLSTPSPVLALVRKKEPGGDDTPRGLCLALDSIRDPGNMGTIMRICDWFGVSTLYLSPDCVDIYNPKVVQATMGAIFRLRTVSMDIPALCRRVASLGGHVYGTLLDGENIYLSPLDNGLDAPSLVVVGNESRGISTEVRALLTDRLLVPPYPRDCSGSESLNAAVATAVVLAEFRRRLT